MQLGLDSYRPSPEPGVGGYQASNGYKTLVNRYDNAAQNTPSLMGDWATRSAKWGTRVSLGRLGDRLNLSTDNPFLNRVKSTLTPYAEEAVMYQDHLGFENDIVQKAKGQTWRTKVGENFKDFLNPERKYNLTFGQFMKRTVIGNNAFEFHQMLAGGRLCSFLTRMGGIALAGFEAIRKTIKSYQKEGVCAAGKTLACESLKGGICWEVGTIGGGIGFGLACFGLIPAIAGSVLLGGLFGAITYKLLSKVIP